MVIDQSHRLSISCGKPVDDLRIVGGDPSIVAPNIGDDVDMASFERWKREDA
jgi:hypothetical protein